MKRVILASLALTMALMANAQVPAYKVVQAEEISLDNFTPDKDGFITIFNGTDLTGWRGYGKSYVPPRWTIEDGCLKLSGSGNGEGQSDEGGDLIFAHQFKDFILEFEWKLAKASNSGVLILVQEVTTTDANGNERYEPSYISAPEYQLIDNDGYPEGFLGDIRESAALYDMIPAEPQNAKPYGEWNTGKIVCYKGNVAHYQNGEKVLEYHLWSQKWTDMLQASKFSEKAWPLAFELLNNCGGPEHKGYIGLQDHGDDIWFRNIRVKDMSE